MSDLFEAYRGERDRLAGQLAELSADQLALAVPATPGWTIRDVAGHIAGDVAGLLADDFPASAIGQFGNPVAIQQINEWTDRMVASRRDQPFADLLDEWQRDTDRLGAMFADGNTPRSAPPFAETVLITDLTAHAHDINGALGIARDRDSVGVRIGIASYIGGLPWWQPDLPSLDIVTDAKTYTLGKGRDTATLRVDRFELFRALSGRRNLDQLHAYDWSTDPSPFLPAFAPYGPRSDALIE